MDRPAALLAAMTAIGAAALHLHLESNDFACDQLQIRSVHGRERISRLFDLEVLVAVPVRAALDVDAVTGAQATLVFVEDGEERRRIHGMIAEAVDLLDTEPSTRAYRLRLVPRAFRMSLVRTQEVFVNVGIEAILQHKLGLVGLEARFTLGGKYDPRDFVVQYDETDLDFVSRLAEHLGWSFFFDQAAGADQIVFTDEESGFRAAPGAETVRFRARGEAMDVYRLEVATRVTPSAYGVYDYNYLTPHVDLAKTHDAEHGYAGGVMEFGTNHQTPEEGAVLARVRSEEGAVRRVVYTGEADVCTLTAGARVTLSGHPRFDDLELLVVGVEHHVTQVALGGGDAEEQRYRAVFEAVPRGVSYRPPRVTPKPKIHGVMTGIIEAPEGVKRRRPWLDEHGRYLVRLLFDTAPSEKPRPSLPVRMAQPHSGAGYGLHMPLRPGTEVLVAFVGGDPDRPVILGSMPNAVTPSPVVDRSATYHRIQTSSGVILEINDGR
jgi:type VI secretion system secreted protein VgrG